MSSSPDTRLRAVFALAWPTVLACVIGNGFRINDQYWVQGLGPAAQAAIGSSTIVIILNFAVIFIAIGGSMPLVARSTGAQKLDERADVVRQTALLSLGIAAFLTIFGHFASPSLTRAFGVDPEVAPLMTKYLRGIYLCSVALVFAPVIDNLFIAMGDTRTPLWLQLMSVTGNLVLNPILIYGVGEWSGFGIVGAAWATGLSRGLAAAVGLVVLSRRYRIELLRGLRPRWTRLFEVIRLGVPTALSIAVYAGVYFVLFGTVIGELGASVGAAFGIGFNVFESVSYPFFLGIAVAGASLVGRCLGADEPQDAWRAVRNVRLIGRCVGLTFGLLFWFAGPLIAPWFTEDPEVLVQALRYVSIIAWSQILVSEEAVNERILLGAGHPRAIFWISTLGNGLRIPIAYGLAVSMGHGAAGVWWAINLTSLLKSALFYIEVQRGYWVRPIHEAAKGAIA